MVGSTLPAPTNPPPTPTPTPNPPPHPKPPTPQPNPNHTPHPAQAALLDNPSLSESWLCDRLEGDGLGKALLRRFDDPADTSREAAVVALTRLLRAAPGAVLALLPYAFPVVSERVMRREEGGKVGERGKRGR